MSRPSRNVTYEKPEEPSFLKAFKAKVGYKEPVGVEAKREVPRRPDDGEEVDREDEQPTVVALREGDLGQDEYEDLRRESKALSKEGTGSKDDSEPDTDVGIPTVPLRPHPAGEEDDDGKMKFRKPTKRKSSDGTSGGVLDASTSKKARADDSPIGGVATVVVGGVKRRRRRSSSGSENKNKQVKNSSLLSFAEDEDEEGT